MTPFFITGFLRSGTTLLEKYLHNHPQMAVASQPFPFLFYAVKEAFYRHKGLDVPRYPLGHLFLEKGYTRAEFLAFAQTYRLNATEVQGVMEKMRGYSGQLTPQVLDMPVQEGTCAEVFAAYAARFPALFAKPDALFAGSKEVFCEEFIPLFLSQHMPVVLILRDPRAVVASIHGGRGGDYANAGLSVLHILRAWRKSVAYAMRFAGEAGFHFMTYEALAQNPAAMLQPLAQSLGLEPFPDAVLGGKLFTQAGTPWRGNSSFTRPSGAAPRYREVLDAQTLAFIEAVCAPEMAWLGMSYEPCHAAEAVAAFRDVFQPSSPALTPAEQQQETTRLAMVSAQHPAPEHGEEWFIFAQNLRALQNAGSPHISLDMNG